MDSFFIGVTNSNPSTSATNYLAVDGKMGAWSATENQVSQVIPHSLTISNLRLDCVTAPGAGKSYTYTVQKNGADTALTVQISGTSPLTQTDSTHSVAFAAGDTISLKSVPAGSSPTSPGGLSVTMMQSSASGQAILFGLGSSQISASTFMSPTGGSSNSSETAVYAPVPTDGTVSNLWVKTDVDPGGSATWTVTMRRNAASISPAISAIITAGQSADANGHITSSDTTNTRAYTAGEQIAIRAAAANSPAASRISGGYTFNPTNAGKCCAFFSSTATTTTGATRYASLHSGVTAYNAAEAVGVAQTVLQACTLETIFLLTSASVAPGTYAVTARANSTTDSALSATISATSANLTGQSVIVSAGDKYDLEIIPASSPTARNLQIGVSYSLSSSSTQTPSAAGSTASEAAPTPVLTIPGFGLGISTASIELPVPSIIGAPAYALATASRVAPTPLLTVAVGAASAAAAPVAPLLAIGGNTSVSAPVAAATASSVAPITKVSPILVAAPAIATAGVTSLQTCIAQPATATASEVAPAPTVAMPNNGPAAAIANPVAPTGEILVAPSAASATASSVAPAITNSGGISVLVDLTNAENAGGGLLLALATFPAGVGATPNAAASAPPPLITIGAPLVALPATATASRSTPAANNRVAPQIMWGAWMDGDTVYNPAWGDAPFDSRTWDQFETNTGKQVSICQFFPNSATVSNFNTTCLAGVNTIRARGAVPLITMGPTGVSLASVAAGTYDTQYTTWFTQAAAWGHPFFLRWAAEMNAADNDWGTASGNPFSNTAADFVAAWRHVHALAVAAGATNISWVWCPNVDFTGATPFSQVYPGDAYVDWTGLDGYNRSSPGSSKTFSTVFLSSYTQLLALATSKPIMIAEVSSREIAVDKAAWITDMLGTQLPQNFTQVKALVWFNKKTPATYVPGFGDEFTDTAGTLLESHSTAHGTVDGATLGWSKHPTSVGSAKISDANRVRADSLTQIALYFAGASPVAADYDVQADLYRVDSSTASISGVVGRYDTTADTGYVARYDASSGFYALVKRVAGVNTTLGTFTAGFAVGSTHTIKLRMVGTQISLYVDDTLRVGPITDTSVTAANSAGIRAVVGTDTTGIHIDNFVQIDAANYNPWEIESSAASQAAFASGIASTYYARNEFASISQLAPLAIEALAAATVTASTPAVLMAPAAAAATAASISPSVTAGASTTIAPGAALATASVSAVAQNSSVVAGAAISTASSVAPTDTTTGTPAPGASAATAASSAPVPSLIGATTAASATASEVAPVPALTLVSGAATATAASTNPSPTAVNGSVVLPTAAIATADRAAPVPALTAITGAAAATADAPVPGVFATAGDVVLPPACTATADGLTPLVTITAAPGAGTATGSTSTPLPLFDIAGIVAEAFAQTVTPAESVIVVIDAALANTTDTSPLFDFGPTPAAADATASAPTPTTFYSGPSEIPTKRTRGGGSNGRTRTSGRTGRTLARS